MFKKTLIAVAAAAMAAGTIGAAFGEEIERTTVVHPDENKIVEHKVDRNAFTGTEVHRKTVTHYTPSGQSYVHKTTVVHRPIVRKTVIVHPTETRTVVREREL